MGATVARKSKGASTGRTGKIIEIDADLVRVHWTRKANGVQMSTRSWIHGEELLVVTSIHKAQQAIADKMNYMITEVGKGALTSIEEGELIEQLENASQHRSVWGTAIRMHFEKPIEERDDWELINGMASQCMDDLFTMICVVGQKAVILLLRTVNL